MMSHQVNVLFESPRTHPMTLLGKNANPLATGTEDEEMLPRKLPFVDRLKDSSGTRHPAQEIDCLDIDDESQKCADTVALRKQSSASKY